jgi:cytochrome P450
VDRNDCAAAEYVASLPRAGAAAPFEERQQLADNALMGMIVDPELRRDPYPVYHYLRETAPMFRASIGSWMCTSYAECLAVLRDARMGKDYAGLMESQGLADWREHPSLVYGDRSLLFANPPEHTRLRRLVSKAFTPRVVARLEPRMTEIVEELLDDMEAAASCDLLTALAFPLPSRVIGELLGVPRRDHHLFHDAVRANTRTLEMGVTTEQVAEADRAALWVQDYFRELIAERRAHPREDMLSAMIAVEEAGDRLHEDEIMHMAILLFAAGFETTTNLIANGTCHLLRQPEQLALLREDPGRIPGAVEELLRYDGSIQISGRYCFEEVEVGGHRLPAGAGIITALGAANRDPARYQDPDRLDVLRRDVEPLSFGNGIHYCLGANLARSEAALAWRRMLARFSTIELAAEPCFRDQIGFRGLESLLLHVAA